jgi:hypothetical protein
MFRSIVLGATLAGAAASAAPAQADGLDVGLFLDGGSHHRRHRDCGDASLGLGLHLDLGKVSLHDLPRIPRPHFPRIRAPRIEIPVVVTEPCATYVPAPPPPPAPCAVRPEPCDTRTFVSGHFVCREERVCEPAAYEDRTIPVYEERQVPVYETVCVPVYEDRCTPKFKKVCDPCTGEKVKVQVGEKHVRVKVGSREEQRLVGMRTERVQVGERHERVCVRPASTRVVVRREWVPGHYETAAVSATNGPGFGPALGEGRPVAPSMPPAMPPAPMEDDGAPMDEAPAR